MNELTMFARLRPDDELSDADIAELRAELFANRDVNHHIADAPRTSNPPPPHALSFSTAATPRRRRGSIVALAAAAIAVLGLGGVWRISTRDETKSPTPATDPADRTPSTARTSSSGPYAVPWVGLGEPGWTVTSASDRTFPTTRSVILLSAAGFDGPWLDVTAAPGDDATVSTVPVGDRTIDAGGVSAGVTDIESGAILRWKTGSQFVEAFGWQLNADEVASLIGHIQVTSSGVGFDPLPPGASLADPAAVSALGHFVDYTFTNVDGRTVEIALSAGGTRGLYQRQGPLDWQQDGRTTIAIGDESATLVDENAAPAANGVPASATETVASGGQYRVDVQRGFWTWEFNTTGFESAQQLVDLVARSTAVDATTWNASLSANIVAPDGRATAVDALLTDVPLPPAFDRTTLNDAGTDDRYQFIAQVSAAVTCGWLDEWFAGRAADDSARTAAAAAALATSRQWTMLTEIASQGGWSDEVWRYADLVNGTVVDPSGFELAPSGADSALGCNQSG